MTDKAKLLESLLQFDEPISQILSPLKTFDWDSDRELIILERQHIIDVLNRYIKDELFTRTLLNRYFPNASCTK